MQAIIILIVAMFSIQAGAGFAKGLFSQLGAEGTSFLRVFFAAIILNLIFRPWKKKWTKKSLQLVIPYGLSLGLMNLTLYLALEKIPLGMAVALEFLGPLSVALLSSSKKSDLLWIILVLVGLYLLLPISGNQLDPIGMGYALFAGLCWALYIVYGKKNGDESQGLETVAIGMSIAALVVLPFALLNSQSTILNFEAYPFALGVALLSSAIPYTLEMLVLKKIPQYTFSILMSLEPVIAIICGMIILQEFLTIAQWFAIGCIVIASIAVSKRKATN